jgi:hypothetical protein
MAAGLHTFWLLVSEGIDRLVLAGQKVLLLQNGGFDGGNVNRTNFVLLSVAITKQSGQRNPVKDMWNIQQGELSNLSSNL